MKAICVFGLRLRDKHLASQSASPTHCKEVLYHSVSYVLPLACLLHTHFHEHEFESQCVSVTHRDRCDPSLFWKCSYQHMPIILTSGILWHSDTTKNNGYFIVPKSTYQLCEVMTLSSLHLLTLSPLHPFIAHPSPHLHAFIEGL